LPIIDDTTLLSLQQHDHDDNKMTHLSKNILTNNANPVCNGEEGTGLADQTTQPMRAMVQDTEPDITRPTTIILSPFGQTLTNPQDVPMHRDQSMGKIEPQGEWL
jgi:hypothetical protein